MTDVGCDVAAAKAAVKTNAKDKALAALKAIRSKSAHAIKALRKATRSIPFLTSPAGFTIMHFGFCVIAFGGLGFYVMDNPQSLGAGWDMLLSLLGLAFSASLIFTFIGAAYLSMTGNWDMYISWWVMRRARKKDRKRAVTTDTRLVLSRLWSPQDRGLMFGMHKATRFPKRPNCKLTFNDDRHAVMIAGSRAGKGTSYIVPNMIHHKGSVIINDPSGETFALTASYRQQVLGQKIIVLDPLGVTDQTSHRWNPMNEIDFMDDPFAIDKCYMLSESLLADKSSDPYWTEAARKMLAMVIAYVGNRSIPEHCHLGTVRDLLMSSELDALWMAMTSCEDYGGIVRRYGEANQAREGKELSSVLETLRTALKFMDSDPMTRFMTQSDFALRDLKSENVTVYIILPAGSGETYAPWTRLLFNAAFKAAQDLTIPKPAHPILFIMDEFALLGRMERLKQAAGEAAKFGVKLFIIVQDISQLKEHYHAAWETFIANSGILIMFANNDLESLSYLSQRLGEKEVIKISSTSSFQSGSTTHTPQLEKIARTDQAEKRASRQSGDAYIFIAGAKPMRLPRAPYYAWDIIPKDIGSYDPNMHINEPKTLPAAAAE